MENGDTFLSKFKRGLKESAIWAFGFRPPQLVRFDQAEVELARPDRLFLAIVLARPELMALLTEASTLTAPDEFPFNLNLLLDIPGRYQFATALFLKQPYLHSVRFQPAPPVIEDLTDSRLKDWSEPTIENLVRLLTGNTKPALSPPGSYKLGEDLWLNRGLLAPCTAKSDQEKSSSGTPNILPVLPPPETENLVQLLTGAISPQLAPPPQYPVNGALWLNIDSLELHDPRLETPPVEELTARMVAGWPPFESLDLFSVLTGEKEPDLDHPEIEAVDLQLASTDSVDVPGAVIEDRAVITVDLFEFLTTGRVLGKNYEIESVLKEPQLVEPADSDICRHGLIRSTCVECNPPVSTSRQRGTSGTGIRSRTGSPKPRVVNLFDLLLPYLQPPIESIKDWSAIFPPDKKLYDFQVSGSHFLVTNSAALLADEMGLGKSIQAIFALRILFRRSHKPMTGLILCPKSVLKDWERKLKEWAPEMRVATIDGPKRLRTNLWRASSHIYLAGYDSAVNDIVAVNNLQYDVIILDEIQAIKSPSTKRTKAIRTIQADRRWGLSATPLENKVDDLIGIFAYLKPGYLRYEEGQNLTRLKNRIKPHFLRRRIKDVGAEINLDEPIFSEVWLQLTPEQQKRYDEVLEKARKTLRPYTAQQGTASAVFDTKRAVLAEITELKKICNFDPVTGQSCKADYLKEKLADICDLNQKALVFSHYPNIALKPLAGKLSKFKPDLFDGSLSNAQRNRKIDEFQNADNTNVLLMSVKAGGVGITLTRANHVFFLDQWWNPAVNKQAFARAYRIGQDKTVHVVNFCVENTIEERIRKILEQKQHLFDEIIDDQSTKDYEKITVEELFEILDMVQFDVILKSPGKAIGRTIQVISELVEISDYRQARKLVQNLPVTIMKNVSREKAEEVKQILAETSGAVVETRLNYVD